MTTVKKLTWSEVCARRLQRHSLDTPSTTATPADIARAMAATHAQVMSAAELGVGLRIAGATREDLRRALWEDRTVVKTLGPRGTVHLLPAEDLPMWVAALSYIPTGAKQGEGVRLAPDQADEVIAAIGDALADAELTIDELDAAVVERTGSWAGDLVMPAFQTFWPRWRQVLHLAGHRGALCFGPGRGRKVTYTSPRRWLPGLTQLDGLEALRALIPHYLNAYGPATYERFAHWLSLPRTLAKELFESVELDRVEVDGVPAYVAKGDTDVPVEAPRGVRLLPYFDNYAYVVGNQPRELLYPGAAAARVKGNFQVLTVDGVVAGLWHQKRSGARLAVTVEALQDVDGDAVDEQVTRVGEILQAKPTWSFGTVTTGGHA